MKAAARHLTTRTVLILAVAVVLIAVIVAGVEAFVVGDAVGSTLAGRRPP